MKKILKQVSALAMSAAMIAPSFSVSVFAAENDVEYKIYPTPHSVEYQSGTTSLSGDINVVYSSDIDTYTRDHVEDVFEVLNKHVTVSDAAKDGAVNVLVGTKAEANPAKAFFDTKHSITTADLLDKDDSYALQIADNTIAILGKDTNGAFYGVSSLKHIFTQLDAENPEVRNLLIQDYADVAMRGFIEGYYGNPWSKEDRIDLMTFGKDYKLSAYIYAPKDDPKHNSKWRDLYTEEELQAISEMAEAGNAAKCYYVYTLHPFMYNGINSSNYDASLEIIKTKFEQLLGAGVRQFGILADDAGVPSNNPQIYVDLMKDLTDWMVEKQAEYPGLKKEMIFCPNDYMGMGSSSQMQTLKALPDSVAIVQTGGMVWGTVGPSFNNTFYNNMGRPAFMWINWPCSDNTKDSLIMGAALRFLAPGTNPDTINGIVLNPMQQSEPSKQGLFTNADYAWNIWETSDKYTEVWNDSFAYIDHGTKYETAGSNGLRELSKHMQHSATPNTDESLELKDRLSSFITDVDAGAPIKDKALDLKNEFTILQKAAADYRANPGNTRTFDQIHYWIDAWDDTTESVINFLDALIAIEDGADANTVWEKYSAGQEAFERSKTHGFHYVDHTEYAKAGRKHVTPFMSNLAARVAAKANVLVNPNAQIVSFITNRSDTPTGNTDNVFDNNSASEIIFKTPNSIAEGEFVGVSYTKPITLTSVTFRLGQAGNANDTFAAGKIQYRTSDGGWHDIEGASYTLPKEVELSDLDIKDVTGVRMIATSAKSNTWLGVKDIVVNGGMLEEPDPSAGEMYTATMSFPESWRGLYQSGNYPMSNAFDGNDATYIWQQVASGDVYSEGDYFRLDLGEVKPIGKIHVAMGDVSANAKDKFVSYNLEVSEDGENWTVVKEVDGAATGSEVFDVDLEGDTSARYVQLKATSGANAWVKLGEFDVFAPEVHASDQFLITNKSGVSLETENKKASASLGLDSSVSLAPGEYVGLDLQSMEFIGDVDLPETGLSLQYSKNKVEWTDASELSGTPAARYVRLINNTDAAIALPAGTMAVTKATPKNPELIENTFGKDPAYGYEDSSTNGAAFDGDVSTGTVFGNTPSADASFTYDLGKEVNVSDLKIYLPDNVNNYWRDAKIYIGTDLDNLTEVFEIGDGVENTDTDSASTSAINSGLYTTATKYPNYVYAGGEVSPTIKARYVKMAATAPYGGRFVQINEIEINNGEYIPVANPYFDTTVDEVQGYGLENILDGSLTTAWKPNSDKAGSLSYSFDEIHPMNRINLITTGTPSNAKVSARIADGDSSKWVEIGTLDHSLNELACAADQIFEIRLEWEDGSAPTISEMITYQDDTLEDKRAALDEAIKQDVDTSGVTEAGLKAYEDAIKEAEAIRDSIASTGSQMTAAINKIEAAIENLGGTPEIKTFTVTFDSDGGSEVVAAEVEENKAVAEPAAPVKEGYTFKGWTLDGQAYDFSAPVTGNLTLKAVWEADEPEKETFTVTFDTDGGSEVAEQKVEEGSTAVKPVNPTKDGFIFKGWKNGEDDYDFSAPVTENLTLKAVWEEQDPEKDVFTVTFDTDGGSEIDAIEVQDGELASEPAAPEKEGYVFKGWTFGGEDYDFTAPVTGDITLVAKWEEKEPEPVKEFTVIFNANGGSLVANQTVAENGYVQEPEAPTREGYKFAGWYSGGELFDFDTPVTEDLTLAAGWVKNAVHTITFDFADNKTPAISAEVEEGKTLTAPEVAERRGHKFVGWHANNELFDFSAPVSGPADLKAVWAADSTELEADLKKLEEADKSALSDAAKAAADKLAEDAKAAIKDATGDELNELSDQVKAMVKAIESANKLDAAIKGLDGLKKDDYTADTWNKLEAAKADAEKALAGELNQDDLDAASKALTLAYDGLVKADEKEPDPVEDNKKPGSDNSGSQTTTKKPAANTAVAGTAGWMGMFAAAAAGMAAVFKKRNRK